MGYDNIQKQMITLLEREYPVQRIKHKQKFKRGIRIQKDEVYFISDVRHFEKVSYRLLEVLDNIFNYNVPKMKDVIIQHLNMK